MIEAFIKEANDSLIEYSKNNVAPIEYGNNIITYDNGIRLTVFFGVSTGCLGKGDCLASFNAANSEYKLNDIIIVFDKILVNHYTGDIQCLYTDIDLSTLPSDYRDWNEEIFLYLKLKLEKR